MCIQHASTPLKTQKIATDENIKFVFNQLVYYSSTVLVDFESIQNEKEIAGFSQCVNTFTSKSKGGKDLSFSSTTVLF